MSIDVYGIYNNFPVNKNTRKNNVMDQCTNVIDLMYKYRQILLKHDINMYVYFFLF